MTRKWDFFIKDIFDAIQNIKAFIGVMTLRNSLLTIRRGVPLHSRWRISVRLLRIYPEMLRRNTNRSRGQTWLK